MFYPVKVLDAEGKIKKVIDTETLKQRHWSSLGMAISMPNITKMASYREKRNKKRRKPLVDIKCKACKKFFKAAKGANRKYCHNPCEFKNLRVTQGKPLEEKPCGRCKEMFMPDTVRQRLCRNPCSSKYIKSLPPKPQPCIVCGFDYIPKNSSPTKYCNDPCVYNYTQRKDFKPWKIGDPKVKPLPLRKQVLNK